MKKAIMILLACSLFCACESCSRQPKGTEQEEDRKVIPDTPMRVLCIGNSFMVDATEFLPVMLKTAGISTVEMDRAYHGGYTLEGYNTNYNNSTICGWMSYRPGNASWHNDNTLKHSLREVVESGVWDHVLFNDGSSAGYAPTESQLAGINALISKILEHQNGHPVKFWYVHTQADAHGYETLVNDFGNDQEAHFEAKNQKAKAILENTAVEGVISTAAAVQNLRSSVLNVDPHGQDLSRDGHHLDYGITRYTAACTVFESIFTPVYGVDVSDIRVRTEWAVRHPLLYATPVTDANAHIALAAAKAAVEKPYEVTDLSGMAAGSSEGTWEEVFDEPVCVNFPVVFPLGYSGGQTLINAGTQSRLRSEGVWECPDQPQAYMRMHWGQRFENEPSYSYITYLASQSKISSPNFMGLWTGDYMEFVIPVENAPAGTTINFYAPFYGRQHPVFWDLEYYDEGEWKCRRSKIIGYGHTCNCSLFLPVGTTYINEDITFAGAIDKGFMRIRLKVVDGSLQGNSQTDPYSMVVRQAPYQKSDGTYGAPVYFHTGNASYRNAIVFSLK